MILQSPTRFSPNAVLAKLQRALEALYRIDAPEDVTEFCVPPNLTDLLVGSTDRRELLLVQPNEADPDETSVGLYISEEVKQRARDFIDLENIDLIDDFCVALEGVSHFVYYTYMSVAHERPVSLVELELQAELDKYLLLRLACPLPGLVERLFVHFSLHEGLDSEEADRYRVANRTAKRYARWVDKRIGQGRFTEAVDDARALYRKPLASKLSHIARAA